MARPYVHSDLPSSEDPVWQKLGDTVLGVLKTPKTVRQLKEWARAERMEVARLVNTLAWLDMRGLVAVDRTTAEPLWSRADEAPPIELLPVPKKCQKCGGLMRVEPQRLACIICGFSIYPPKADGDEDVGAGFV